MLILVLTICQQQGKQQLACAFILSTRFLVIHGRQNCEDLSPSQLVPGTCPEVLGTGLEAQTSPDIGATEADDAVLAVCNGLADIGVVISRQVTSALVQAPSRPFTHP